MDRDTPWQVVPAQHLSCAAAVIADLHKGLHVGVYPITSNMMMMMVSKAFSKIVIIVYKLLQVFGQTPAVMHDFSEHYKGIIPHTTGD